MFAELSRTSSGEERILGVHTDFMRHFTDTKWFISLEQFSDGMR